MPNFLIQEAIRADVPWREHVVSSPLSIRDGFATLADVPGLGIDVNEAEAAKYPFKKEVLMHYFYDDTAVVDW